MRDRQVWMFSGQGSQYYQMAVDLYESDAVFRHTMDHCSDHVRSAIGTSLSELVFKARPDRFAPFDRTLYTHPALFSVQYSLAQTLLDRGLRPDILLGYSLGEWVAQVVAGVLSPEAALDLLVRKARRVETESAPGAMLAVLDSDAIMQQHPEWFQDTYLAARNFDRHFVVSGLVGAIERVERRLRDQNLTIQRLPVSQAFHSPLMDSFQADCVTSLAAVDLRPPAYRVVSSRGEDVTAQRPVDTLWKAGRDLVAFQETVALLEREGTATYIDCGPSGTLATFVKYNLPRDERRRAVPLVTPFGHNRERIDALQMASPAGGAR